MRGRRFAGLLHFTGLSCGAQKCRCQHPAGRCSRCGFCTMLNEASFTPSLCAIAQPAFPPSLPSPASCLHVPNSLFAWLNASAIACLQPCVSSMWHQDPRFIVGVAIDAVCFVVNRSADWTLRSLRSHPDKAAEYVRLLSAFARQCNTLTD
jgi:hypothetical protein